MLESTAKQVEDFCKYKKPLKPFDIFINELLKNVNIEINES